MRKLSHNVAAHAFVLFLFANQHIEAAAFQNRKTEIVFEGNKIFSSQTLLNETHKCFDQFPKSQDPYDSEVLDYCFRTVNRFMNRAGFLRATVGNVKREETEGALKIIVPIEERARYRLAEVKIEGARLFSTEQLAGMLQIKVGDIADADEIGGWLFERVKKAYADKGYIEYTAEVTPDFQPVPPDTDEGLVSLKVSIDEGGLFLISRIEFTGNSHTSDPLLRHTLLIQEDQPFSQQLFEDSLKKLNDLELFERVDAGKDIDFNTDREKKQLRIVIHLREKDQT